MFIVWMSIVQVYMFTIRLIDKYIAALSLLRLGIDLFSFNYEPTTICQTHQRLCKVNTRNPPWWPIISFFMVWPILYITLYLQCTIYFATHFFDEFFFLRVHLCILFKDQLLGFCSSSSYLLLVACQWYLSHHGNCYVNSNFPAHT